MHEFLVCPNKQTHWYPILNLNKFTIQSLYFMFQMMCAYLGDVFKPANELFIAGTFKECYAKIAFQLALCPNIEQRKVYTYAAFMLNEKIRLIFSTFTSRIWLEISG